MTRSLLSVAAAIGMMIALVPGEASAQLFRDQMNSGAAWGANVSSADTLITHNYDYSANGIPEAPNSLGTDDATRGVKMEANLAEDVPGPEVAQFLTLYPIGQNFTGDHVLRFDAWMNLQAGGDSSTEFLGGGVGYDNVTADVASGAQAITTSDGGSASDWRAFKSPPQFFIAAADMTGGSRNNSAAHYTDFFPSVAAPAGQGQLTGSVAGVPGFQWITWEFAVVGDNVSVTVEKPNGDRLSIVGIDCGDTSDGSSGCMTDGNVSLFYADFFASISPRPDLQFGIIDNVVVTVPEPASLLLLALSIVGFAAVRRR